MRFTPLLIMFVAVALGVTAQTYIIDSDGRISQPCLDLTKCSVLDLDKPLDDEATICNTSIVYYTGIWTENLSIETKDNCRRITTKI